MTEPTYDPIYVSSTTLREAASSLRERVQDEAVLLKNGARANATQLEAAAQLVADGPKSRIDSATGVTAGSVSFDEQEAPGYVDNRQPDETVLRLKVGIIPGRTYDINRAGEVTDVPAG